MRYVFALVLFATSCALFRSATVAPADDSSELRGLLIDKYRADLVEAIDNAPNCSAALAAVGVVEAKYTTIWTQAKVDPAPPVVLHCAADAGFE